jgi:hypothetical protein
LKTVCMIDVYTPGRWGHRDRLLLDLLVPDRYTGW